MAWNQPGNNGQRPNPWGGGGNKGGTPPGLDDFLKKLNSLFGGGAGGGSMKDGDIFKWAGIGLLVLWAAFGFYRVEQAEEAVVFRFGEFHHTTTAGLHWAPPLIDRVQKANTQRVEQTALNATMITEDANIVDIALSVQYRISDAKKYLMQVSDPEASLVHASESALRHVVGSSKMIYILNEGRATIARDVQPRLQNYLDSYNTGLTVTGVNVLEALPPKEVKAAFDDVIRAKEDKERLKNQAETYANGIVPEARGQAARLMAEAEGYKLEVVNRATGDASRFDQLITEYRKAPAVTRTRLYQETMESVLGRTTKIMVEGGNNQMLYLPLDKMVPPPTVNTPAPALPPVQDATSPSGRSTSRLQESRS
ncbi:MAG: FtsH protease activity modulator HflK [Moraxellaceae bacterium]|nr:FtsH protease activity modulator HflK [Moraxellaceae bacterium]